MNPALPQVTHPSILKAIGHPRLVRFFQPFEHALRACNLVLPPYEPANDEFFCALADILSSPALLPERLGAALFALEAAASPQNKDWLDAAIQRRIPGVSLSHLCPLDRALELWFTDPQELSQFIPLTAPACPAIAIERRRKSDEGGPLIKNHPAQSGTKIKNGDGEHRDPPQRSDTLTDSTVQQFNDSTSQRSDAPTLQRSDEAAFTHLALLSRVQYDRIRKSEAARLGIRIDTLDAEVARLRSNLNAQGTPVDLQAIEPWHEPVDGAAVLNDVADRYTLQLILPPGAADAFTLWSAHTHAIAAFLQTPRLNLYSIDPGCGKTTALDVIASLVPRPLRTESLTAPVLFRLVDQHQPTLLLDEVDTYLTQAEELRGLLNAGHKRGACAYRCEGDGNAVRSFKAFAPAALAGIGPLPGTLADRSIAILLLPAQPGQVSARLHESYLEIETVLCSKLARWTQDNFPALKRCKPAMPATAFNRLADNWRPLFAIAEIAGGDWPQRALDAFSKLAAKPALDGKDLALTLLADLRHIFAQSRAPRLFSSFLINSLCALPNRPYSQPPALHPLPAKITEAWLARRLSSFGIRSHTIRIGPDRARGYHLAEFVPAFDRFLVASE